MGVEFIRILPDLLWFFGVVIVILLFYRPIRDNLLPNLTMFKAMGVEISFVRSSIASAIRLADKSPRWKVEVPEKDREHAINRARSRRHLFRNRFLLWVDDRPENNINERRMFHALGLHIDKAADTDEALRLLAIAPYDVIISDMERHGDPEAGRSFLERRLLEKDVLEANRNTPVIIYLGDFEPNRGTPPHAFGITNRPDTLLHLVLDALEHSKPASA